MRIPSRRDASGLPPLVAAELGRVSRLLRGGAKLIALCVFIALVGMLSPRLTPQQAGVVALVGMVIVLAGGVVLARFVHHLHTSDVDAGPLRALTVLTSGIHRLGLPILALAFFLVWTFLYLALYWYHPGEAFSGLPTDAAPRFADFFYYSVMTALVSPPGDIIATSRGTRSATMIEMLTGLALVATYLSSFVSTPARGRDDVAAPTDERPDPGAQ